MRFSSSCRPPSLPRLRCALRVALTVALVLVLVGGAAAPLQADVLTTTDGLVLEGRIEKLPEGWVRVHTRSGALDIGPKAIATVEMGVAPRATFLAEAAKADAQDPVALYRLALTAEAKGFADLSRAYLERVLVLRPDHPAARRALGYERVGKAWLAFDEAQRRKGLVLYRGRWMLPDAVEAASAQKRPAEPVARDAARARALIEKAATGAPALQRAARLALARTDSRLLLAAGLAALYDKDARVRIAAARLLAALGDEGALRALLLSGARDKDAAVRREAVLAAQAFGNDDTALPFVRALGSRNRRLVGYAAEALALLGDERAAPYIVKRLRSHGSSTRNFVSFLNQVSYVRDFDVEIAQASNIANPDVATISEGVVLDVKVLDASFTRTWIEPILVKAFNELVGEHLRDAHAVGAWYELHKGELPRFPTKPGARAPRRSKGRVIGVPLSGQ